MTTGHTSTTRRHATRRISGDSACNMSSIKVTIKPTSGGDKFQAEVETSATVRELKEEVARKCDTPADQQRLIYKGQVLKDDKTVESYGMLVV